MEESCSLECDQMIFFTKSSNRTSKNLKLLNEINH